MRKAILFFSLLSSAAAVWLVVGSNRSVPAVSSASKAAGQSELSSGPSVPLFRNAALANVSRPQDPELAEIFGPLFAAADDDAYQQAQSAVYFDLTGRLRAHPELVGKIESMLGTEHYQKPAVRIAVGALAGAGTPEAQAALARLVDTRKGDGHFLDLLVPTMGFATRPTPALQGALRRLAESDQPADVRQMAHLALGNTAGRMQGEDPAGSKQIIDSYDRALTKATRDDDVVTYLGVLGNAATPEAAQVVGRYLHDSRSDVRAEAVDALRRVPTESAERELTNALQKDADSSVRAAAASALGYRQFSPALVQAETAALTAERDPQVAQRLLDNLWATRGAADSDALTAVSNAAESHPVAAVRQQAHALLEGS